MPAEEKKKKKDNWVIRLPRSDNANEFVLVHVSSSGKAALDLKFIATEGENPYVGSLRQSRLRDIRSKNFQGTEQEFEQIVTSVLKVGDELDQKVRVQQQHGEIETTASIREAKGEEGNELVIGIRKRIDSITQRVASITLQQKDDQTIELFEWMGLTLSRADTCEQQISSLTGQLAAAEKSTKDLKSSLDDLVKSKKDHENLLVTNFAQILNEKKLKIRNQQRLLAAANVDPEKVRELQEAVRQDQAQKSRHKKRKATGQRDVEQEEEASASDENFEKMDVDTTKPRRPAAVATDEEENEDEERLETPQPLEEETESEVEEQKLSTASSGAAVKEEQQQDKIERPNLANNAAEPLPPRRDLPFLRRDKNQASTRLHSKNELHAEIGDEDGETDDDEL